MSCDFPPTSFHPARTTIRSATILRQTTLTQLPGAACQALSTNESDGSQRGSLQQQGGSPRSEWEDSFVEHIRSAKTSIAQAKLVALDPHVVLELTYFEDRLRELLPPRSSQPEFDFDCSSAAEINKVRLADAEECEARHGNYHI